MTDYAYVFDGTKTVPYVWGKTIAEGDGEGAAPDGDWPNMKDVQNVTFGERSGVTLLGIIP